LNKYLDNTKNFKSTYSRWKNDNKDIKKRNKNHQDAAQVITNGKSRNGNLTYMYARA
jgi:hypothetical protein